MYPLRVVIVWQVIAVLVGWLLAFPLSWYWPDHFSPSPFLQAWGCASLLIFGLGVAGPVLVAMWRWPAKEAYRE